MTTPAKDNSRESGSARRGRTIWAVVAMLGFGHAVLATETLDDDIAADSAATVSQPAGHTTAIGSSKKTVPTAPELLSSPTPSAAGSGDVSPAQAQTIDNATAPSPQAPLGAGAEVPKGVEAPTPATPFKLLGAEVPPGEIRKLSWFANQQYSGIETPTPVLVAHGSHPGKVLCVTAAIHGDEINGIEIARRVFYRTDPKGLYGTLVVVPITNLHGFERGYRYLSDRRDLNRYFPGVPERSSASRIAHSLFTNVIRYCHALVDLHTGSFHRTNLPQLRADLSYSEVVHLTQGFGTTAVLKDKGAPGTLRRAATDAGIPAVVLEAGEPMRFQPDAVSHGTKAVESLMYHLGMVKKAWYWRDPQPIYYDARWVRASQGGILMAAVQPGDKVASGQLLGTVTDPINNVRSRIVSPQAGRILGMAVNQMVMPGYAVFRIGIERTEAEIVKDVAAPIPPSANEAAPENDDTTREGEPDTSHADE